MLGRVPLSHNPLCGTKIAPFALHIESARTQPGTGQNGANKHLTSLIAEITERWTGSLGL